MKIRRLKAVSEIPLLIELVGGNQALEDEVMEEFEKAERFGKAMFVRYERGYLQRTHVDVQFLSVPGGEDKILDDKFWTWDEEGS